jgi:uncharacterized protein YbaR (Trm112 family)
MPIDRKLLEILCCPATKVPVRLLEAGRLESLNAAIAAGQVKNRSGEQLGERLEEALITEDEKTIYEIRNGIPIMLIEKGIPAA